MKTVTSGQMREIDERSEKEFGVKSTTLMENAGNAAAQEAALMLKGIENKKNPACVVIVCGRGNNGGDGIACGRRLKNMGVHVELYAIAKGEKPPKSEVLEQIKASQAENLEIHTMENPSIDLPPALAQADLIVDAILGTGASGKPSGPAEKAIQKIMKAGKPILALDAPSGISADTGYHTGVFITATVTVTFGLAKEGLLKPHAQRNVGKLVVADIGHPKELL